MPIDPKLRARVLEAARLTRAGKVLEATASIRRALGGAPEPDPEAEVGRRPVDVHGEVTVRSVNAPPAARGRDRSAPFRAPGTVPGGGQFLTGSYTNRAGTRSYKLYVPGSYRAQALPLVVMLHGCTQNPDDFAVGTRMNELAEERACFVAYPAQAASANGSSCWNWFQAGDQRREQGEPSLIAGITGQVMRGYHVDARRVFVAGLSAGGAMAAVMGATYPDLYAAVGVHSGLAYAVARDLPSALAAMRQGGGTPVRPRRDGASGSASRPLVPTIVFHGDRDTTVHPRNGDQVIAQGAAIHTGGGSQAETKLTVSVQKGGVPGGRAYTRTLYLDTDGRAVMEQWLVHGAGHAWSGGSPDGSYTDPKGPDATREMLRFFGC